MYEIIKPSVKANVLLSDLKFKSTLSGIVVAEKGDIQDILTYTPTGFTWQSLYLCERKRTQYSSLYDAVASRFDKGMTIRVYQNRKEFADSLKHHGIRVGALTKE